MAGDLERWRWLPHEFGRPPIVVNISEFRLGATNAEYRSALSMKVVVGRAFRHRTPVFASEMKEFDLPALLERTFSASSWCRWLRRIGRILSKRITKFCTGVGEL